MRLRRDLITVCLLSAMWLAVIAGIWVAPRRAIAPNAPQSPRPRHLDTAFPRDFERYFDTHVGFRRDFISLHAWLNYAVFDTAPSKTAFLGRDGWLFLNQERMYESLIGAAPFSAAELDQWAASLEACRQHVAAWGGKLLVTVAPNKGSIYPERLPGRVFRRRRATRLDQLAARLATTTIPFLDLRPALSSAKLGGDVYGPHDTHWNGRGARAAALAIVAATEKLLGKGDILDDRRVAMEDHVIPGDLVAMVSLGDWVRAPIPTATITDPNVRWRIPAAPLAPQDLGLEKNGVLLEVEDGRLPTVVIHRDSFATALRPILGESFRRSFWLWTREFNRAVIDQERPDIVILEVAERYLEAPPLGNPF